MTTKSEPRRDVDIRSLSEAYGHKWCRENAPTLVSELRDIKEGKETTTTIRAYDRTSNSMYTMTTNELVLKIQRDNEGRPVRLPVTKFGQVMLTPSCYVSVSIYELVGCALVLIESV